MSSPAPSRIPEDLDLEIFRQMADVSWDAFYLADASGRLRYVNERAITLTGYSREDLLEMTVFDIDPVYTQRHFDMMVQVLAEHTVAPFEADVQRRDGTRFPAEITPSRVEIDGEVFFFGAVRDISERKQVENVQRDFAQRMLHTVEAERQRVARELHDDVGQGIATLGVLLKALEQGAGTRQAEIATALAPVHTSLGAVTESIARIVRDYHPADLMALGLEEALRGYARQFASRHGLTLRLHSVAVDDLLDEERQLHVYRIAQAALTNIVQHAEANQVTVRLRRQAHRFELTIRDDGKGFSERSEADAPTKLGLVTMRERAELAGGSLTIQSAEGRGTEVRLRLAV